MMEKDMINIKYKKPPRIKITGGIGAYKSTGHLALKEISIHKDYDKFSKNQITKLQRKKLR